MPTAGELARQHYWHVAAEVSGAAGRDQTEIRRRQIVAQRRAAAWRRGGIWRNGAASCAARWRKHMAWRWRWMARRRRIAIRCAIVLRAFQPRNVGSVGVRAKAQSSTALADHHAAARGVTAQRRHRGGVAISARGSNGKIMGAFALTNNNLCAAAAAWSHDVAISER